MKEGRLDIQESCMALSKQKAVSGFIEHADNPWTDRWEDGQ